MKYCINVFELIDEAHDLICVICGRIKKADYYYLHLTLRSQGNVLLCMYYRAQGNSIQQMIATSNLNL